MCYLNFFYCYSFNWFICVFVIRFLYIFFCFVFEPVSFFPIFKKIFALWIIFCCFYFLLSNIIFFQITYNTIYIIPFFIQDAFFFQPFIFFLLFFFYFLFSFILLSFYLFFFSSISFIPYSFVSRLTLFLLIRSYFINLFSSFFFF